MAQLYNRIIDSHEKEWGTFYVLMWKEDMLCLKYKLLNNFSLIPFAYIMCCSRVLIYMCIEMHTHVYLYKVFERIYKKLLIKVTLAASEE